jgi:hypothetical protein
MEQTHVSKTQNPPAELSPRGVTAALALLAVLSWALPALGQGVETVEVSAAQRQYNDEGVRALVAGNPKVAAGFFKSALNLGPLNLSYLNLGRASAQLGDCVRAREAYAAVPGAPKVQSPSPAEIANVLERFSSELDSSCSATLAIVCPSAAAMVSVDDLEPYACAERIPLTAGSHTVRLGEDDPVTVVAAAGSVVALAGPSSDLGPADGPAEGDAPQPIEQPRAEASGFGAWGWTATGIGAGFLLTALAVDRLVLAPKFDDLDAARTDATRASHDAIESSISSTQTLNMVLLGAGAVSLSAGLVVLLWPDHERPTAVSFGFSPDGGSSLTWSATW